MAGIHIIGAGLAGLAAAVRLAGAQADVTVHEGTGHPGGRCRSYHDFATDLVIDNGNHLLLTGNSAAFDYARAIGSESLLVGPDTAEFNFFDLATRKGWRISINDGPIPWWVLDAQRRVPGTSVSEYFALAKLLWAGRERTIGEVIDCAGPLYERLVQPLLVAALNIDPREGSAALAGAVIRATLAAGGKACRPRIAADGLGKAFVEPAIRQLQERGATVRFTHELRALRFAEGRVAALDFGAEAIELAPGDAVVLAVPAYAAAGLVPGLVTPTTFRAILNAHFRVDSHAIAPMTGVLGGTAEWIFAFPGRVSVTTSNADRFMGEPREALAKSIWEEVCAVTGLAGDLPRWQIVRERRATFAATPQEDAKRPGARTAWSNLVLAGDWTATGLPATIEGAIRSGYRAAELVTQTMSNRTAQ
jgi:squalene-associated FAD-dependent desaturase